MKIGIKLIGSLLLIVFSFMLFSGCQRVNAEGYVVIDINPSVEFITDSNDIVVKVNALNSDGETLIYNEDFIGMDVSDTAQKVVDLAIELGYLDVDATIDDPNAVMITTIHYNNQRADRLRGKIYNKLDQYLMDNGVWTILLTEEDVNDLIDEAESLGISPGKLRLIKSIQTVDPDFNTNEGAKMSVKGLISIVRDKQPFQTKIESLEARIEEINSTLLTLDEKEDSEEILALNEELINITTELNEIQAIKEQIIEDRTQFRENLKDKLSQWRQNRRKRILRERWEELKENLTPEQKRRIRNYLYNQINQ